MLALLSSTALSGLSALRAPALPRWVRPAPLGLLVLLLALWAGVSLRAPWSAVAALHGLSTAAWLAVGHAVWLAGHAPRPSGGVRDVVGCAHGSAGLLSHQRRWAAGEVIWVALSGRERGSAETATAPTNVANSQVRQSRADGA